MSIIAKNYATDLFHCFYKPEDNFRCDVNRPKWIEITPYEIIAWHDNIIVYKMNRLTAEGNYYFGDCSCSSGRLKMLAYSMSNSFFDMSSAEEIKEFIETLYSKGVIWTI